MASLEEPGTADSAPPLPIVPAWCAPLQAQRRSGTIGSGRRKKGGGVLAVGLPCGLEACVFWEPRDARQTSWRWWLSSHPSRQPNSALTTPRVTALALRSVGHVVDPGPACSAIADLLRDRFAALGSECVTLPTALHVAVGDAQLSAAPTVDRAWSAAWRAALRDLGTLSSAGRRTASLLLPAGEAVAPLFREGPEPAAGEPGEFGFVMDVKLWVREDSSWAGVGRRSADPARPDRIACPNSLMFTRRCRAVYRYAPARLAFGTDDGGGESRDLTAVRFEEPVVALVHVGRNRFVGPIVTAEISMRGAPPPEPAFAMPSMLLHTATNRTAVRLISCSWLTTVGAGYGSGFRQVQNVRESSAKWTHMGDYSLLHITGLLLEEPDGYRGPQQGWVSGDVTGGILRDYVASQRGRMEDDAAGRIARLWRRVSADPRTPVGRRVVMARFWDLGPARSGGT